MCPDCNGLGTRLEVDLNLIVEHPEISILDGASRWFGNVRKKKSWHLRHMQDDGRALRRGPGGALEGPAPEVPRRAALRSRATNASTSRLRTRKAPGRASPSASERGVVYHINRLFRQTQSEYTRRWYISFMSQQPCPTCGGTRLCSEARNVTIGGQRFPEVLEMTIEQAHEWVVALTQPDNPQAMNAEQLEIVGEVLKELRRAGCASCSTSGCTTCH